MVLERTLRESWGCLLPARVTHCILFFLHTACGALIQPSLTEVACQAGARLLPWLYHDHDLRRRTCCITRYSACVLYVGRLVGSAAALIVHPVLFWSGAVQHMCSPLHACFDVVLACKLRLLHNWRGKRIKLMLTPDSMPRRSRRPHFRDSRGVIRMDARPSLVNDWLSLCVSL